MDESLRLQPILAAILDDLPLEELALVPVPVKQRRDGWTPGRQQAFILRLAPVGGVAATAKAVGMSREGGRKVGEYVRHDNRPIVAALNRLLPLAADPDPAATRRRLLDEVDPAGTEAPGNSDGFYARFA